MHHPKEILRRKTSRVLPNLWLDPRYLYNKDVPSMGFCVTTLSRLSNSLPVHCSYVVHIIILLGIDPAFSVREMRTYARLGIVLTLLYTALSLLVSAASFLVIRASNAAMRYI